MRLSAITPAGRKQGGSRPASRGPAARPPRQAARSSRPIAARVVATAAATRSGRGSTARATGHPRSLRPTRTPTAPRRVSGPAIGTRRRATTRSPASPLTSAGRRTAALVRSLPNRTLIDRLVRGRAWIPVLGVMLAGIVAMQVEVLKLGASVGRSIESSSALQTRNELLRASVASLSDEARIERLAAGMGMIMPAPGSAGFLTGANVSQAIADIHAPSPTSFLTASATNGSVATSGIMSSSDGSIAALLPGQASSTRTGTAATATSAATTSSAATTASAGTSTSTAATTSPATAASASTGVAATSQPSGTSQSTTTGG